MSSTPPTEPQDSAAGSAAAPAEGAPKVETVAVTAAPPPKPGRVRIHWTILAVAAAVLFMSGILLALAYLDRTSEKFSFLYQDFTIASCLQGFAGGDVPASNVIQHDQRVEACYEKLFKQGLINEFQIRRLNFQKQFIADNVLMWMVVCLTLSGVGLAALQLFLSSRIFGGEGETNSEIFVEKGKVYLKSSVTGLFILIVSFGFFYTYIIFVYQITEVDPDQGSGAAEMTQPMPTGFPSAPTQMLDVPAMTGVTGGLGPPPGAGSGPDSGPDAPEAPQIPDMPAPDSSDFPSLPPDGSTAPDQN